MRAFSPCWHEEGGKIPILVLRNVYSGGSGRAKFVRVELRNVGKVGRNAPVDPVGR